jgi:hypothetical protein
MEETGLEVYPDNEFCCLTRLMMCEKWVLRRMFGQRGGSDRKVGEVAK